MLRVLPVVLLLLGGLLAWAQEAAPVASEPAMTEPARLDWTLTLAPSGDALEVRYTVTSTSDQTIYLADLTPVPGEGGFLYGERFINVAGTPTPGLIRLVRGRLPSVAPTLLPLDPGARAGSGEDRQRSRDDQAPDHAGPLPREGRAAQR